ncbi:MAG: DUF192 domain-containing protein [Rubricoccaceae bacterium]|nr:DUF192 domain-containing protein [Rubricoccaceae bacterium]
MHRLPLLLLPLLVLAACGNGDAPAPAATDGGACEETPGIAYRTDARLQFLRADGAPVKEIGVEIVDTDSTIQRGLMDRRCLPDDWGMLFEFPDAQPRTFYMANTPRSLDIMFFAPDSTLLNVAKYAEPLSPEVLPSIGPARFVVETPAGFADRYGLATGDRITWSPIAGTSAAPPDSAAAGP